MIRARLLSRRAAGLAGAALGVLLAAVPGAAQPVPARRRSPGRSARSTAARR